MVDGVSAYLFTPQGAKTAQFNASGAGLQSVAVDPSGNAWIPGNLNNTLYKITPTAVGTLYTGNGLTSPTTVAVDGQGQVWVTNTASTVSTFSQTGTALSGSPYTTTGANPNDIAFNAH